MKEDIKPAERLSLVSEYYFSRKLKEVARIPRRQNGRKAFHSSQVPERRQWLLEALTASLNKFGRIDLPYMTELSDMPEQELTEALKGRIYYNPLIDGYEIADRNLISISLTTWS